MATQISDVVYCPDLDTRKIPGALTEMSGWAPLQSGFYGSAAVVDKWTVASLATLAKTFPNVAGGTVRFLVFSDNNIDEYSSTGSKTNRGTGYTDYGKWSAAQWGDRIIATNYLDVVQTSTGTSFGALGGSPPKARLVAANVNFVMLAATNDGSAAYADEVFWCALRNPELWTPSIATQCGRFRLLDAPGHITQLVAYRDKFYAFKENSIFVGEYVGPPGIFQWRLVSSRIGACGKLGQGVVECNDKLYFAHVTGFYEFNGSQLVNVGKPCWRTILNTVGYGGNPKTGTTGTPLSTLRMVADDVEGIVWIMGYTLSSPDYTSHAWGYNVVANKWSEFGEDGTYADMEWPATWVQTNQSDMRTFLGSAANVFGRVWRVSGAYPTNKLHELRYPYDWAIAGTLTTGLAGSTEGSSTVTGVQYRIVAGSETVPFASCTLTGYVSETLLTGAQSATATVNAELERFDGMQSSRLHRAALTGTVGKTCILAGIGIEFAPPAKR